MGVPTTTSNTPGASPPEHGQRYILNCSPTVAENILETRSQKPSPSPAVYNTRSRSSISRHDHGPTTAPGPFDDPGSMEMWGWAKSVNNWSQEQKDLLLSSWRESSRKTYQPAWKRWCSWTQDNKVDTLKPSAADFARFLIDLHQKVGLSYSTILVHKSAIATLTDPDNQVNLSSHALVRHALKAISIKAPKADKVPIWDTEILINWLKNSTIDENSFYECTKRAAILLLLCSGRRVHDLTLLSINSDNCIVSENLITFWPIFGSKTDSVSNRQSGWRLFQNSECKNLDPVFWIKKVISLSADRRNKCKSNNLFITVSGTPKSASRTVIANWIKKVLLDAGIQASPGSVRPAVASKNWVQDFPLDDILARGNWRSQNTFLNFYRREIRPLAAASSITNCFAPI
ncbi:uncharacterized protein LOC134650763 [Cydia amplana]|uniref:uncharacterized protein LOC134650763 n=1 Tax=Cydia amplana TaxID=1869771 RepID=UPI002FE67882